MIELFTAKTWGYKQHPFNLNHFDEFFFQWKFIFQKSEESSERNLFESIGQLATTKKIGFKNFCVHLDVDYSQR